MLKIMLVNTVVVMAFWFIAFRIVLFLFPEVATMDSDLIFIPFVCGFLASFSLRFLEL